LLLNAGQGSGVTAEFQMGLSVLGSIGAPGNPARVGNAIIGQTKKERVIFQAGWRKMGNPRNATGCEAG